jgi:hypothetical protein
MSDKPKPSSASELDKLHDSGADMSASVMPDLHCEPAREMIAKGNNITGIYVRARSIRDGWGSHDIAELDEDSLEIWLKSRGPVSDWAIDAFKVILGHRDTKK